MRAIQSLCLILCFAGLSSGAVSVVDKTSLYPGVVASSVSVNLGWNPTTHNLLVVGCNTYNNTVAVSVTDSALNTYTQASATPSNNPGASLWYAKNITGGSSFSVTCNFNMSTFVAISVLEASGADLVAPLNGTGQQVQTTSTPSAPLTTTSANQLIVSFVGSENIYSIAAGSGYTLQSGAANFNGMETFTSLTNSAGSYTGAFVMGGVDNTATVSASFKPAPTSSTVRHRVITN